MGRQQLNVCKRLHIQQVFVRRDDVFHSTGDRTGDELIVLTVTRIGRNRAQGWQKLGLAPDGIEQGVGFFGLNHRPDIIPLQHPLQLGQQLRTGHHLDHEGAKRHEVHAARSHESSTPTCQSTHRDSLRAKDLITYPFAPANEGRIRPSYLILSP